MWCFKYFNIKTDSRKKQLKITEIQFLQYFLYIFSSLQNAAGHVDCSRHYPGGGGRGRQGGRG